MSRKAAILSSDDLFLAIDDSVFASCEGASKCLCEAKKYEGNPVLKNSVGGADACRAQVLGVCEGGRGYQMWYLANDAKGRWYTCYAESVDGFVWEKPALGIVEYEGSTDNNIVIHNTNGGGGFSLTNIYRDETEADAEKRYKAPVYGAITGEYFLTEEARELYGKGPHPGIKTFAYSGDGIHWRFDDTLDFPLRRKVEGGAMLKRGDTWLMVHQMLLGEYAGVARNRRYLGVSYSKDFQEWEFADEAGFYFDDALGGAVQTHMTPAMVDYGNVSVGVLGVFYNHDELYHQETDLVLVMSNDGYHWREAGKKGPFEPILRRGDAGAWDGSFPVQGGLVNCGDKTLLYYSASNANGNLSYVDKQVGVAEWGRDRFGYLTPFTGWGFCSADVSSAVLMTEPILIKDEGVELYVNGQGARLEGDGFTVGLVDEDGGEIAGYGIEDCDNVREDGLDVAVRWHGRGLEDLRLAGRKVRVRFELVGSNPQHAVLRCTGYPKLYGFRFGKK